MPHDEVMQVLNDPLAQELLGSNIPMRLAYTGRDGTYNYETMSWKPASMD